MKYFLSVIAMVMIIEGLPYFLSPAKMREFVKIISELDSKILRTIGLTLILFGLFILYLIR